MLCVHVVNYDTMRIFYLFIYFHFLEFNYIIGTFFEARCFTFPVNILLRGVIVNQLHMAVTPEGVSAIR